MGKYRIICCIARARAFKEALVGVRMWPLGIKQEPVERVDWFRMLTQMQAEGYSLHGLVYFCGIPKSSLIAYKNGMQPSYNVGKTLIRAWSEITGQDQADVPTISPYSFKA